MTGQWLRFFAGATLTLSIAGHALAEEGKVTVFAAASLTNAMQDIAKEYKKEKGVEVVSSFASSSGIGGKPSNKNWWKMTSRAFMA